MTSTCKSAVRRVSLKYGCNPNQGNADFGASDALPVRVRNGTPSMINMLDALNGWQLVAEHGEVLTLPAAASFKHVSPAGAAVGAALSEELGRCHEVGGGAHAAGRCLMSEGVRLFHH